MAWTANLIVDIDRFTGDYITGWPRCRQSIATILTTRIGTRVLRRWWGSDFINAMDKPSVREVLMDSIVSAIEAINAYEPEFFVSSIRFENLGVEGSPTITVDGTYLPEEAERRVQVTL